MSAISQLTADIKREAARLGFDLCRIVPVETASHADFFDAWIAAGRAGEMHYLARYQEKRRDPQRLAEPDSSTLQTLIVLGVNYYQFALPPVLRDDPSRGVIASYAWGDDYHEIIRPRLYQLDAHIRQHTGRTTQGKALVDTGPVLERDWAQRAGLGFIGKNTCLIHLQQGSWLFLATLLIPEPLLYDPAPIPSLSEPPPAAVIQGLPAEQHYGFWHLPADSGTEESDATGASRNASCGRCTRCLTACPTDAFVGPFHLDPLRCISYWTIEARSPIPRPLRPLFGNRIFGCDICQEVCPWNLRLPATRDSATPLMAGLQAQAERIAPPLLEGFDPATPYWLNQEAFSRRFRRSPIKRAKRAGMLRNVCVALGNWAAPATVPALTRALADPEPLARGHAAWALGEVARQHDQRAIGQQLTVALAQETDPWVREEIALIIQQ